MSSALMTEKGSRMRMDDTTELENQYSPSRWSKRFSSEEIIGQHIKTCQQLCVEAKNNVPHRLDVSYGSKERSKLDIFGEDLPKESTILIYVHGGFWQELNKSLSHYPAEPLYKNGVMTVIMEYTLAPDSRVEEIVEEVKNGVEWVVDYAKERGSKAIYLMGWSAGAQLVTQVMSSVTDRNKIEKFYLVKGVITLSGVFDLRPLVQTYINNPLFLNEASAWNISPLRHIEKLACNFPKLKMLITVAENESPEFKRQTFEYYQVAQGHGIQSWHETIKDVDHFNLVENLSCLTNSLTIMILKFVTQIDDILC